MIESPNSDRWWWATLLVVSVFGLLVNHVVFLDYVFEDAYITYCYSQNLVDGNGLVFNPGERVLGTSTPFYALLLAGLHLLGLAIPTASSLVSASGLVTIGVFGAMILRRYGAPVSGLLFAVLVQLGVGNSIWGWGMETPLYTALLLAALWAAIGGRPITVGLLLALGFLTRYDGALFAVGLLALLWIRERRIPWTSGLVALALVLPWLGFAQLYYGSIFPNTLGAKAGSTPATTYLVQSARLQTEHLWAPIEGYVRTNRLPSWMLVLTGVALLGPIALRFGTRVRSQVLLTQLLLFPVLLWGGYALIGPGPGHSWHLLPAVYFLLLASMLSLGPSLPDRPSIRMAGLTLAGLLLAALPFCALAFHRAQTDTNFYRGRVETYREIGEWVVANDLTGLRVLMAEPGYFRFLTGNPMIDAAGLVTPGVRGSEGRRSIGELIADYRPDLIVSSTRPWTWLDLDDYLPLYEARPVRTLLIRRKAFIERFENLASRWRRNGAGRGVETRTGDSPLPQILVGFDEGSLDSWTWAGRMIPPLTGSRLPFPHGSELQHFDPPFLRLSSRMWGGLMSPERELDFDELQFSLAGDDPKLMEVSLVIDGQAVLTARPQLPFAGRRIRWPVEAWAGRKAALLIRNLGLENGILAVDEIRSCGHHGARVIEDFEGEDLSSWPGAPIGLRTPLEPLAREHGLRLLTSGHAATTRDLGEITEILSEPITVEQDALQVLILDFGGPETAVEIIADDSRVVARWAGRASGQLQPLIADVSQLRGSTVRFRLVDQAAGSEEWIGIDNLTAFDDLDADCQQEL